MAFFSLWACVLVGCFSASLAEALNLSAVYPPLWDESPGQLSDYRVENRKYIIDPWIYLERMGMYRILLNKTAKYFETYGPENEQNTLWGLPLQHGWQYGSGRLADPTGRTDCGYESNPFCISEESWWADLNYFLCVLPFLSAVDSGIMGIQPDQVILLPPPTSQTKFCLTVSSCWSSYPELMKKWNTFYQHLKSDCRNFDGLLVDLWAAHTSTLFATSKYFEDRFDNYAVPETNFGKAWIVVVEYLAIYKFPTVLHKVYAFQKGLPPRLLATDDKAPFISDFTDLQNMLLSFVNILYCVNSKAGLIQTLDSLK
ncbi:protein LEG1 homolog [Erinaceus europaeus]|uniref:Protein LEG1 homolog n=1 Tax=Erinaceus europaeus TaxID=9365 RepID=A0ABM3XDC0_ERIEU|nr:protein LEG1 homolog [Erinaceus europaeus]